MKPGSPTEKKLAVIPSGQAQGSHRPPIRSRESAYLGQQVEEVFQLSGLWPSTIVRRDHPLKLSNPGGLRTGITQKSGTEFNSLQSKNRVSPVDSCRQGKGKMKKAKMWKGEGSGGIVQCRE